MSFGVHYFGSPTLTNAHYNHKTLMQGVVIVNQLIKIFLILFIHWHYKWHLPFTQAQSTHACSPLAANFVPNSANSRDSGLLVQSWFDVFDD